jgi:hypothetical protein
MNTINQLKQFREEVYQSVRRSADGLMNLIDALSSQTSARSVAELSLEPAFERQYSSVYQAIADFEVKRDEQQEKEKGLLRIIGKTVSEPERNDYWLFGTDGTPAPRPYARTMEDRGFVYQPNVVRGNKPVTIGHSYSILGYLPERGEGEPNWIVPLMVKRIKTQETDIAVGLKQLAMLMTDDKLPWSEGMCVHVADTKYGTAEYLNGAAKYDNLVDIIRLRSNRTLYLLPTPIEGDPRSGHPTWYGEPFRLGDPATWPDPDQMVEIPYTSRRGRLYTIRIETWDEMLMRGTQTAPMHDHPFRLIHITWLDEQGLPVFKRPMWLAVFGKHRQDLSLPQIQQAYAQRFDLEHFNRFGKQRLLLTAFQTPDVHREENWWLIAQLAYVQLWLARYLADYLPRPWERYLPPPRSSVASPSATQRAFRRIIGLLGSPARSPKPRGYSPGRPNGACLKPRERFSVVKKTA